MLANNRNKALDAIYDVDYGCTHTTLGFCSWKC